MEDISEQVMTDASSWISSFTWNVIWKTCHSYSKLTLQFEKAF